MTKVKISDAVDSLEHFLGVPAGMRLLEDNSLRTILAALKRSNDALRECASSYETAIESDAGHLDLEMCAGLRDTAESALSDEIEI